LWPPCSSSLQVLAALPNPQPQSHNESGFSTDPKLSPALKSLSAFTLFTLANQHTIAVAIKPVSSIHSMPVGGEHVVAPCERRHQR